MKKFTFLPLLFFSLLTNAQSQTNEAPAENKIGGYSLNFGAGCILPLPGSFDVLNNQLQKNNYATVPAQFPTWNLDAIHGIFRDNVFNLNIDGIFKQNTVSDSSKTTLSGSVLGISVGRLLYHSNKILFYPMAGVGFGRADMHSHFTGLKRASDVSGSNEYRVIDFSLHLDWLVNGTGNKINWWSEKPGFHATSVLSFSAGFRYCPVNTYWNDNNYDISSRFNSNVNYPANVIGSVTSSSFSSFYFTLKYGFGIFSRR